MATQLQEDLADAIVKNKMLPRYKRKNKGELVKSVGYSAKVADRKSTEIIEQKGVQKALEEKLEKAGLTRELIENALVADIKGKPKKRVKELALGAAILGITEHDKGSQDKTLIVIIAGQSSERYGVSATQQPGISGGGSSQV